MESKPSALLKTMAILSIISGELFILGAMFVMGSADTIASYGIVSASFPLSLGSTDAQPLGETTSIPEPNLEAVLCVLAVGVGLLIVGVFILTLGIMAVRGKCDVCKGFSFFLLAMNLLGLFVLVYLELSNPYSFFHGPSPVLIIIPSVLVFAFPILILIGVKQTQQKYASLSNTNSAN